MTDWKALCAELVEIVENYCNPDEYSLLDVVNVLNQARAALAQPEPEGVTDPVPVSERLPGPEDCSADGECWYWDAISGCWFFLSGAPLNDHYTRWLPHHALPLPTP